jgi:hypothetical protein
VVGLAGGNYKDWLAVPFPRPQLVVHFLFFVTPTFIFSDRYYSGIWKSIEDGQDDEFYFDIDVSSGVDARPPPPS